MTENKIFYSLSLSIPLWCDGCFPEAHFSVTGGRIWLSKTDFEQLRSQVNSVLAWPSHTEGGFRCELFCPLIISWRGFPSNCACLPLYPRRSSRFGPKWCSTRSSRGRASRTASLPRMPRPSRRLRRSPTRSSTTTSRSQGGRAN